MLPANDKVLLDKFSSDFRLKRGAESGLSLIVPFVEDEITYERLVQAVVDGYFYPILCGQLTVEVEAPDKYRLINSTSLIDSALEVGGIDEANRLARVELAEWAAKCSESDFLHLRPCPNHNSKWSDELFPNEMIPQLRTRFLSGQKVAVRAHLTVRTKGGGDSKSYFDVFLWNREGEDGRPIFIREGLTITDVRGARARGVLSLVVAQDKPIATLLGDSENPAHTQWQRDSSNFKNKYVAGSSHIDFVKRAASRIVEALRDSGDEYDVSTLSDIFPRVVDDAEVPPRSADKPKPKPGSTDDERPKIDRKPSAYVMRQTSGGFTIQRGNKEAIPPKALIVRVAYDLRQGNPLKKYHEADFRLDRAPIKIESQVGIEVSECLANELRFDITNPDFNLTISGFDQNRDLYVNVKAVEADDVASV